jgi:hypothetical protein
MDELRKASAGGAVGLEEVFLKLTGTEEARELVALLREPAGI